MTPGAFGGAAAAGAGRHRVDLCGGCQERGSCRMGVLSWAADRAAATVTCRVVCAAADRAGPGVAHGGWTAGVFDDVLGRLPRALGEPAVTGTLTVVYRRPVPVEQELELSGRLVDRSGRRRTVDGELRLTSTGALLASASAVMVVLDETHFAHSEQRQAGPASQPADAGAPE